MKIPPEGGFDSYPLSPMQQGMLYHSLEGERSVDVQQVIGELPEAIDPARFEEAWRDTIERHEVLRTSFEWDGRAEPRQVVEPMTRVRLAFHYAEFGSEREARRGLEEYLAADRREGFPALDAPLLRVALLRGGPARHWFVTTYHHILLDARSMTLMFREALERHDALVAGQAIEFPPARPYRGYIEWLQTIDLAAPEGFWRAQLAGFSAPTPLPIARSERETEAEQDATGELMFRLAEPATAGLRRAATRHGVTLNTMVQAAWSLVLSRHAGEDDVVFGALRACRHVPVEGADTIVGLFINTVPVRVRVAPETPVAAWLKALREQWLAIRPHEHTPLVQVQRWSEVGPGRPLFETLLNFQEPAWDTALNALGGKWGRRSFDIRSRPNYPLAVDGYGGATLTTKLFFERGRFEAATAARLLGHFRVVLEALATDQAETIADLPMLTRAEREQILVRWNRTEAAYPREHCVHQYVEAQAEAAPERLAVADARTALTYGELNARANRLAHRLATLGVGADGLVAVCMERSTEMIVAWLAALKAGAAFVPLDPGYPKERLAFQLQDCGARVLLTQPQLRASLPAPQGVQIVDLSVGGGGCESEPESNPAARVGGENVAYIIYTSGSTGRPKGVQIEHRGLMNLVTWHQRTYALTFADCATHLASPAFDASVWEIWPYLATGASVHIPDDETRVMPARLWRWMAEKGITMSFMPTPLAEAAMSEAWPERMALRALLTGGDKLKRRPPANFPCALINHYGPTESTVVATCAAVEAGETEALAPTIGAPIANTTAYVVDSALRIVPVGVAGELWIGGESLARGYLHRPELDAEKFVRVVVDVDQARLRHVSDRDPSADERRGQRLYRTGDLVRWNARGQLEFLGRMDGQVKIRGCRIELGEIEATLQQHPEVREVVVLVRPDEREQPQLVAYVVAAPASCNPIGYTNEVAPSGAKAACNLLGYTNGGASSEEDGSCNLLGYTNGGREAAWMGFLKAKLPGYMVPAAIVVLDAWPLTPNGKIDRAALPAPATRKGGSDTAAAAPRTEAERRVAQIWTDVLGRRELGCDDNFFDLGGHSLLAAQVIARVNATLPAPLSVRVLFDHPTLAGFARELELWRAQDAAVRVPLHRLKRRASRPEIELVQPN